MWLSHGVVGVREVNKHFRSNSQVTVMSDDAIEDILSRFSTFKDLIENLEKFIDDSDNDVPSLAEIEAMIAATDSFCVAAALLETTDTEYVLNAKQMLRVYRGSLHPLDLVGYVRHVLQHRSYRDDPGTNNTIAQFYYDVAHVCAAVLPGDVDVVARIWAQGVPPQYQSWFHKYLTQLVNHKYDGDLQTAMATLPRTEGTAAALQFLTTTPSHKRQRGTRAKLPYHTTTPLPPNLAVTAMAVTDATLVLAAQQPGDAPCLWTLPLAAEGPLATEPVRRIEVPFLAMPTCLATSGSDVFVACDGAIERANVDRGHTVAFCALGAQPVGVAASGSIVVVGTIDYCVHVYALNGAWQRTVTTSGPVTCVATRGPCVLFASANSVHAFGDDGVVSTVAADIGHVHALCDVAGQAWLVQKHCIAELWGGNDFVTPQASIPAVDVTAVHGAEMVLCVQPDNSIQAVSIQPRIAQVTFVGSGTAACALRTGAGVAQRIIKVFGRANDFAQEFQDAKAVADLARRHPTLRQVVSVMTDAYEFLQISDAALEECQHVVLRPLTPAIVYTYAGVPLISAPMPGVTCATLTTALRKLLDGLDVLHENGIIHGDVAENNVMLQNPDTLVLIDFGQVNKPGVGPFFDIRGAVSATLTAARHHASTDPGCPAFVTALDDCWLRMRTTAELYDAVRALVGGSKAAFRTPGP